MEFYTFAVYLYLPITVGGITSCSSYNLHFDCDRLSIPASEINIIQLIHKIVDSRLTGPNSIDHHSFKLCWRDAWVCVGACGDSDTDNAINIQRTYYQQPIAASRFDRSLGGCRTNSVVYYVTQMLWWLIGGLRIRIKFSRVRKDPVFFLLGDRLCLIAILYIVIWEWIAIVFTVYSLCWYCSGL